MTIGHNSGVEGDKLKSLIERIEKLEDEKRETQELIRDIYNEAKGEGFDPKTMRKMVRLRRMKPNDRREQHELATIYGAALGLDDLLA